MGEIQFSQIMYEANLIEPLTQNSILKTQITNQKYFKISSSNLMYDIPAVSFQSFPASILKAPFLVCLVKDKMQQVRHV